MIALAIVAILVSVALPAFERQREKTRIAIAASDIGAIASAIKLYENDAREFPSSLAEVGYGANRDPWGRPYEYFNLQTSKGNGKARKDKKLSPLNTDFDLYSLGKDGLTMSPLNAKASRDDIVRARDGAFIGLATDFDP